MEATTISSAGAATTTRPSRDDYRMILPTLPSGTVSFNTLFLHADPLGRPYNVGHFSDALRNIVERDDVSSFGPFLYNHLWAITFESALEKEKLLARSEITVKGKKCVILDPNKKDIFMKLHWVPKHVPDEAIIKALSHYGKVTSIVREKWRDSFFEGLETTTRHLQVTLKGGVTAESLPHQTFIAGCQVLLAIPGRPPLCLRCKTVGHIRNQCHTPWCKRCKRFGHEEDECVDTYASRVKPRADLHDVVDMIDRRTAPDAAATDDRPPLEKAAPPSPSGACVSMPVGGVSAPVVRLAGAGGGNARLIEYKGDEVSVAEVVSGQAAPEKMSWDELASSGGRHLDKEDDEDSWVTPKRKKSLKSPPATLPPRLVEDGHSSLDDAGFLSM